VTLYNKGQEYRRHVVSPAGDHCDWYGVSEDVLRDALMAYDPCAAVDTARPIRFSFARIDAETYLLQRQLFARVSRETENDPLFFEESALGLLDRTLAGAYGDGAGSARPATARRAADDIAHDASELLGRRFTEPLTLAAVATAIGTSQFHLCRSFHRSTGTTLHEHRNQLRLRTSLDRLEEDGGDLSQLALELGDSSHSHFTACFRRAFGVPPSAARRSISAIS
jgi:AraC-like DNA-binding protein